ncbi:BACON domain-containing protein [Duganella radicis]|uniref:Quinoprotein amine dehydrogenase n=1 Tax=Duganella radicis TaxID=551988 RepID=A0A6L6PRM8_9BURK|nr:quinoprotein amine dehydrogenase [Duganella radicis]MTV41758.1 quinoprotein amine dehydrogenase [Duganella radicis]
MKHILSSLALAAALAACGGGGGNGGGGAPEAPLAATLSFSPNPVTATLQSGQSSVLTVNATVNRPADFNNNANVFVLVTDTRGVLLPQLEFTPTSATSYTAALHTSPSLAAGSYSGNFTVSVCYDTGCARHYAGSPMQLPFQVTVNPGAPQPLTASASMLNTTYVTGAAAPGALAVAVNASGAWSVSATDSWIKLANASGSGKGTFSLQLDPAGLAAGSYSGGVVIAAGDGQKLTVPVSLTVTQAGFAVDTSGITFSAINGAPVAPQDVSFNIGAVPAGTAWSASIDSGAAGWLGVSPASGVTPGRATLTVNPARGALRSGSYSGNLLLNSPVAASRTVPVTLNLIAPTLALSRASVTLGGALGRDSSGDSVTLSLNTGANTWPWSLSALPAWLKAGATGGKVGESGAALSFTPQLAAAATGTTTVTLNAGVTVNGDVLTQPLTVSLNKDKHRLLPSETGVGLVSTPGWSRLTRSLTVSDNLGLAAAWSASSSQGWLTVARSGNTLTLSANPAALAVDTLHLATVTLSSGDATVAAPEPIRVALWKGAAAPSAMVKLTQSYAALVSDPVRPYVYLHNGGASIDVYNVYTARRVATIGGVAAALGDMAVSPSGDRLYAYDTANRAVAVVDLAAQAKSAGWSLSSAVTLSSRIKVIRPNGVEVVLAADGKAYLASGKAVGNSPANIGDMAATADGKHVYVQDEGYSPASLSGYDVDYSEVGGGSLFVGTSGSGWFTGSASNGADIAVSASGDRVYAASGAPYACRAIDPKDMSFIGYLPGGDAYPNNVEVGSDGRIYCGISGWYSAADVWVYNSGGALLTTFKFAGYARALMARQLQVSADGMMLAALTDDPLLVFIPVGP